MEVAGNGQQKSKPNHKHACHSTFSVVKERLNGARPFAEDFGLPIRRSCNSSDTEGGRQKSPAVSQPAENQNVYCVHAATFPVE